MTETRMVLLWRTVAALAAAVLLLALLTGCGHRACREIQADVNDWTLAAALAVTDDGRDHDLRRVEQYQREWTAAGCDERGAA